MVTSSTMDAESIGLVKDYVNELLSYVPAFVLSLTRWPTKNTQFSCDRTRQIIPLGVSKRESTISEYLAVIIYLR